MRRPISLSGCLGLAVVAAAALSPGLAEASTCAVAGLKVSDWSRTDTSRLRFAPTEVNVAPISISGLLFSPSDVDTGRFATLGELVRAADPSAIDDANAGQAMAALIQRYGGPELAENRPLALAKERTQCRLSDRSGRPSRALVVINSTLTPALHEPLARRLTEQGLATAVVQNASLADLTAVVNHLAARPGIDASKIAFISHGAAGRPAVLFAMANTNVRSLVSLDGFEAVARNLERMKADPGFAPDRLKAAVLHWSSDRANADASVYSAALFAPRLHATIASIKGSDFFAPLDLALLPDAVRDALPAASADRARLLQTVADVSVAFVVKSIDGTIAIKEVEADARRRLAQNASLTGHAPHRAHALTVDGQLDETIWRDAREIAAASGKSAVIAEDSYFLYVALKGVERRNGTTEVWLDLGPRSSTWAHEDVWLHSSNSLCASKGAPENYQNCGRFEPWWGANNTQNAPDGSVSEYFIAKATLGAQTCSTVDIGIGFLISERTLPESAKPGEPPSWPRVDIACTP